MSLRQPDLFSYIVDTDSGFAPNPYGGICTLACCKPQIRQSANVQDWVIGTTPSPNKGRLVYAMRIDRALTFDMYWKLQEYDSKKPNEENSCGDNIYHEGPRGTFIQAPNPSHTAHDVKRDTSVNRVLISKTFYYFGKEAPKIPEKFISIIHTVQGHKRIRPNSAGYGAVTGFLSWLEENYKQGVHGEPAHLKKKCKMPVITPTKSAEED